MYSCNKLNNDLINKTMNLETELKIIELELENADLRKHIEQLKIDKYELKKQLSIHVVVKPLPSFLYEDDGKIYTGVRGDADITKNWEKYIGAKNTERLMYIDKYLK